MNGGGMKILKKIAIGWVLTGVPVMALYVSLTATPAATNNYYDVRNYGAHLNDDIDDSAAVQLAINTAASNKGGTVYFPAGVIMLASPVNMKPQVSLLGTGTGSVIRAQTNTLSSLLKGVFPNVRQISIEDLDFDGNGYVIPWAIDFNDAIELRIANVNIEKIKGGGIWVRRPASKNACWMNFYENIGISINNHAGIGFIHGDSDSQLVNIRVDGAEIGIVEEDGGGNQYRNLVISNCTDGFVFNAPNTWMQNVSICDSIFSGNSGYGMRITNGVSSSFITLNGNVFSDNHQGDLYLKDTGCISIENNEFQSSLTNDNIYMDTGSVDSISLVDNQFAGASQALAGTKSVETNNVYCLSGTNFETVTRFDIGTPPIIPGNVACDMNVMSCGAIGDGTNDDTTSIQNALDAASDGQIVYFPPGNYLIKAPLYIKSSVTLLGDGFSISKLIAGTNLDSMICGYPAGETHEVLISKLAFYGTNWNVNQAIKMDKMTNSTIDRVSITYISGTGVTVPATYTCNTIRSSSIHAHDTQISLKSSYNTVDSVYAGGGRYADGCRIGLQITGGARWNDIYTSHFDQTSVAAVYFTNPTEGSQNAVIRNCFFDQHQKGLYFDYDSSADANVRVEACGFFAITVFDYENRNADRVYLHGNAFIPLLADLSPAYIYHEDGGQDYIDVVGNVFKQRPVYSLPGAHSVNAANTWK